MSKSDEAREVITGDKLEELKTLARGDLATLKTRAKEILSETRTSAHRLAYLSNQINKSRDAVNILSLMYNAVLSGEGMSSVGSKYQKRMD